MSCTLAIVYFHIKSPSLQGSDVLALSLAPCSTQFLTAVQRRGYLDLGLTCGATVPRGSRGPKEALGQGRGLLAWEVTAIEEKDGNQNGNCEWKKNFSALCFLAWPFNIFIFQLLLKPIINYILVNWKPFIFWKVFLFSIVMSGL